MYRGSSGRSSQSSSSRSKESSSSGSRSSRTGTSTSGSTRDRSPRRTRSPSPRGRRQRSPSSSRSSRRSPSPRRTSRRRSLSRRRSRSLSRRRSRSLSRRRSRSLSRRRSRSLSRRRSRSLSRRRSRSPSRRRSRSPSRRRSRSSSRHSPSRHSESSVEQSLQITVGNDRYSIDTPERRRLSDRLGSPVDSLSDVDRDDLADGPIFSRSLSRPRSLERYPSHEENPSSPFNIKNDEDYRTRDVFVHQSEYSMNYDHLKDLPRPTNIDGEPLKESLYSSEERGRDSKRLRCDRDDRLRDEPHGYLPGTRNYRKRSRSRSPSPPYLDAGFRELESARRKRAVEELNRNLTRELPGSGYVISGFTNSIQASEPRYLYRPDEAPAMPKKSILKKRTDDPSVQPEAVSSSSVSVKELPLLSNQPPLPQRNTIAPFSAEVENFLKRFNKNAVAESTNKESQDRVQDWKPLSGLQQNDFPFEQNLGSFLKQKECNETTPEPIDRQNDFLLPHERVSQDGSGFSRILGMMADSASSQEKRRRSFPDIEDEEKFLYGDDEDDSGINSPSTQKLSANEGKEPVQQKVSASSSPTPSVKPDTSEESRPEYEKIHDLLKTIGLDIGVAEIGKLAARTQERLHGKKPSRSPDRQSAVSRKPESREMRRSRSDTRSPESSQKHSLSPSGSFPASKDTSSVSKSERTQSKTVGHGNAVGTPEVPQISLIPSAPPSLPTLPPTTSVSQYSVSSFSPFTASQLSQSYPTPTMHPAGYDAYGRYMAYAASGWPMYPPPQQADPALSEVHGLVTLAMPPNPTRPNLRVIETVSTGKGTSDIKRDESVLVQIPTSTTYPGLLPHLSQASIKSTTERISDERNRASQKQKVIEEREKLKAEQEARQKKLHYLRTELERLSKQQGEMLRKKRREKDGHKDPLLVEVNRLQENIVKEIAQLKIDTETAEKKQSELDKVAQILGIYIFEKSRKQFTENKDSSEKDKSENANSLEKASSSIKDSKTTNDKPKAKSPKLTESSSESSKLFQLASIYDYYDSGNHWCKDCNTVCGSLFDFFTHMHNKKHRQTLDPYNRPWASKTPVETKQDLMKHIDKIPIPAKGSEFLIPVTGYYCQLCHEFFGDQISAEQHVKSHPHNEKYKKYVDESPLYEERRNLDRQAGLSIVQETERRLKRKQGENQKDDKDEKNVKVARKEELKSTKEPGGGGNENEISKKKEDSNGQKFGVKGKMKKDGKEEKKTDKKEDSQKDSKQSSFGKFSWRKAEKDDKTQGKDVSVSNEENSEEGKDKSQSGKTNSKPIAIKLSGKTVIPHTSPWTPVVATSSQAKIRPNLPVPIMVLRKSATATVSKPAPLNTFLSIKSSGTTAKPLPVVKEGNPDLVLPPDIISKAFGGEVVVLKGSQDNSKLPEGGETQEHESVTKAKEHAKALEQAKACAAKVHEQAMIVAKAQAKARELATIAKKHEFVRLAQMNEQAQIFERPHRRPPLLPLPPGPPLSLAPLPRALPLRFPPPLPVPVLLPVKQYLADDMAPGVSEDDKNILAMPMCPRPLPPPTVFRDQVKKLEKRSCLAAGNAKDLYDIFYNKSGRSPADSKPANSAASEKEKLNPIEREKSTDMLADSKQNNNSSTQDTLDSSSDDSKIPVAEETPQTSAVKSEMILAACEGNLEIETSVQQNSQNICISDTPTTAKTECDDFPISTLVSMQNAEETETPASTEFSVKTPELEGAELTTQMLKSGVALSEEDSKKPAELEIAEETMPLPENNAPPSEDVSKNVLESETVECKSPDDKEFTGQLSEDSAPLLQVVSQKPPELESAEITMQMSKSSVAVLEEVSKKPAELEIAEEDMPLPENSAPPSDDVSKNVLESETVECKSPDAKELTGQLLEDNVSPLQVVSQKPPELESAEITMQMSKSSVAVLEEVSKKPAELEIAEEDMPLPENNAPPSDDVSKNVLESETVECKSPDAKELTGHLLEDNVSPLQVVSQKPPEFESAEITMEMSKSSVAVLEEVSKKPAELEIVEEGMPLPENNAPPSEDVSKNVLESETVECKSPDAKELTRQLLEDNVSPLQVVSQKPPEFESAEITMEMSKSSVAVSEEVSKETAEFEIAEEAMPLSGNNVLPSEDVSKNVLGCETVECKSPGDKELTGHLPEDNVSPSQVISQKLSEVETAEFKCSEDNELPIQLPDVCVPPVQDVIQQPSERVKAELAMQLLENYSVPLEDVSKNSSELESVEFTFPHDKELAIQFDENETDYVKKLVAVRDLGVKCGEDVSQNSSDQQKMKVHDTSMLNEVKGSLEMKADVSGARQNVTNLDETEVEGEHLESPDHPSVVSQVVPESCCFEMQIGANKEERPNLTDDKQIDNHPELTISTWVSEMCVQNQVAWEPVDPSSKVNEENPQEARTDQSSSKDFPLSLKLGSEGFDRLDLAISEESPRISEVQNMDPDFLHLNKSELGSFHTDSKEQGLLVDSQSKNVEDLSVGHVLESGEMSDRCLANVTMTSSTLEKHEEINQKLSCEAKHLQTQGTEDLVNISTTNNVESSSGVEMMFVKDETQEPSESDMELNDMEERGSMEAEHLDLSTVQPEIVQESLDALPTKFGAGHLGEEPLSFTDVNTGALHTSADSDFDLSTTYSELRFAQSAALAINLNVENERESPKSDEIKPTDPPRLKPGLELENIDFSLGGIEVEREHLCILPSEILNEDTVESPKLETIVPMCLESSKTSELDMDQPEVQPEIIDFVALASGDQNDKICSLVPDVADPQMSSPASNVGTTVTGVPLFEMQGGPLVSEIHLQAGDSKGSTSDTPSLSCDGKMESQVAEFKKERQTSAEMLNKAEEIESNDSRCEVNSKLPSEVTEGSGENLVSSDNIDPNA